MESAGFAPSGGLCGGSLREAPSPAVAHTQQFHQLQDASAPCKMLVVVCALAWAPPTLGWPPQHHHYQIACHLAASSNTAGAGQAIRGKALLGNL